MISGWRRAVRPLLFWNVTQRRLVVVTDVSGHNIGFIFKSQGVREDAWRRDPYVVPKRR